MWVGSVTSLASEKVNMKTMKEYSKRKGVYLKKTHQKSGFQNSTVLKGGYFHGRHK
jgi:hypothetical protein